MGAPPRNRMKSISVGTDWSCYFSVSQFIVRVLWHSVEGGADNQWAHRGATKLARTVAPTSASGIRVRVQSAGPALTPPDSLSCQLRGRAVALLPSLEVATQRQARARVAAWRPGGHVPRLSLAVIVGSKCDRHPQWSIGCTGNAQFEASHLWSNKHKLNWHSQQVCQDRSAPLTYIIGW